MPMATGIDSMRAAIELSTSLLASDERRFFRRLGVFTGPFDLGLATAVAGDGEPDRLTSLDLLARLVERSLVTAEMHGSVTRYRLLELLREHALEELAAAAELDAVQERFVAAMVADRRRHRRPSPHQVGSDPARGRQHPVRQPRQSL